MGKRYAVRCEMVWTDLRPACSAFLVLSVTEGCCAKRRIVEGVALCGEGGLLGADVCGGHVEVVVREIS